MPCFHPLDAWQTHEGEIHFYARGTSGKKGARAPNYRREITLPCGRCIGCRLDRSKQWAVRCLHEAQQHTENAFITLTFETTWLKDEDSSCPHYVGTNEKSARGLSTASNLAQEPPKLRGGNIASRGAVGNPRLRPSPVPYRLGTRGSPSMANPEARGVLTKDISKFIRRLRKTGVSARFYACGEYGEKLGRPHYHVLLFGHAFTNDRYKWTERQGTPVYRSPTLEKLWPYGNSEIGELTYESCAYVARYVMKKITGTQADNHYERTDPDTGERYWLPPEFNLMSRRPGIGKTWFDQYRTDVYTTDKIWLHDLAVKPPRYYDKLLELVDAYAMDEIRMTRQANTNTADNTPARLAVRENVLKAKLAFKKRNLENT